MVRPLTAVVMASSTKACSADAIFPTPISSKLWMPAQRTIVKNYFESRVGRVVFGDDDGLFVKR